MVPDPIGTGPPRTHPHRGAAVPVRGLPEELRTKRDPLQAFNDSHGSKTVQLPALPQGFHSERAVEGAHAESLEQQSFGYPVALLLALPESVLPRLRLKQASGHPHG